MNPNLLQAQQFIQYARHALRNGDRRAARRWAEQAAALAPQLEDPWLILAAVASPRASLAYIERALQINPDSPRALQGMQWALRRLQEKPSAEARPMKREQVAAESRSGDSVARTRPSHPSRLSSKARRTSIYPILLLTLGCLLIGFVALTASISPVLASIARGQSRGGSNDHPPVWAQVEIAKPTYTPQAVLAQVEPTLQANTPTPLPPSPTFESVPPTADIVLPDTPTPEAPLPTDIPSFTPTFTPEATFTPGQLVMEVLADTPTPQLPPTSEYSAPTAGPPSQSSSVTGNGVRWIDINLSEQRLYAYEGDVVINTFIVSTGTWAHPTVTGTFKIWHKTRVQDMSGPGYYLPDVPYVMYFYKDYGIHGTYWHNNFGTPMSHGCVNMTIPDAAWLYSWAYEGMTVRVHY